MLKMAEPMIHHRSPEFNEIFTRVNDNLKYLFQTKQPVLTLTCSGTGGVEATFVSLFSPGDTIISVNGGKFGERWVEMPKIFGLNVVEIKVPWGKAPTSGQILEALTISSIRKSCLSDAQRNVNRHGNRCEITGEDYPGKFQSIGLCGWNHCHRRTRISFR